VQEFSGEKNESTIFGGNSCSYLDGRGDHKYFSWQWLAEEIISVLRFFLPSRRHSSAAKNFLNVLRESVAKFA
jgi:hypothetical protein